MALVINHNIAAMNTHRNLVANDRGLSTSLEKLSSGFRINRAGDDPAGLVISEQLRSQISGLARAIQNSQEASNVIGITEGALIEMNDILNKMKALAIHAANSGITAPDQIRADQAEVDSGIQTIDRIANTTRYADQFLLNGSKSLVYDRRTLVDEPQDHALLDRTLTRIDQVFRRTNSAMTVAFAGAKSEFQANPDTQARRAVFECDPASGDYAAQVMNDRITADQNFIVTGNGGSRQYRFTVGYHFGDIVKDINASRDSTGVGAQLIFDSSFKPDLMATPGTVAFSNAYAAGDVQIYGKHVDGTTIASDAITSVTVGANLQLALRAGINCDGDGCLTIRVANVDTSAGTVQIEFYKDKEMTMLVGLGDGAGGFTPANNSGLTVADINVALNPATIKKNDIITLAFAGIQMNGGTSGATDSNLAIDATSLSGWQGVCLAVPNPAENPIAAITGVNLGVNTDPTGNLFFKAEGPDTARVITIYKDSQMRKEDIVAQTVVDLSAGGVARIQSIIGTDGKDTGLNFTLNFAAGSANGIEETATISFKNLGMRLYSTEYGSDQYVRIQNNEGNILASYAEADSSKLVAIEQTSTSQVNGNDAKINLNGSPLFTTGLTATVSTQDYAARLNFNSGKIGSTTIAQTGYDYGGIFAKAGALQCVKENETAATTLVDIYTYATNPRKATSETLFNFIGGMQFQLGGGAGDQERTVYGIPSMTAANLGKITWDGTLFTLQDVLGGGLASLSRDPIMAMRIIETALNDVSELRARLGAFQKNMLQTNINSLSVTVENLTATESAIRDTDMAHESSNMVRSQIMTQAATAMLAQANNASQNILQLLGR